MQTIATGILSALPLSLLEDETEARKKGKKSRRKKKRKGQQPSAPAVRADATCPLPQDDAFIVGSLARLAQSFTAGVSGDLVRVELGVDNRQGSSNNYLVRLAPLVDGLPGEAVLATAEVAAAVLPASITTASFTFSSPARVVAGTSYTLVLAVDGQDNFSWISRTGTACGGRGFLANGLSAPFEPRNELDFVFTTFVQA
ncbi:MAG: choice-of-anchor R domain-containing protein [Thermomicrobiales bacterium]